MRHMPRKERLDILVTDRSLAPSRTKASAMIMAAEVLVDGQVVDKPGMKVAVDSEITVKAKPRYVGRGGLKLEGALLAFNIAVQGKVCADVGASTGGFTDCLLQNGAKRVYAIDVAQGIIDYALRQDDRVTLMEKTNARYLEQLDEPVSLVAIDVSFISLKLILPSVQKWLSTTAEIITLIKPQFEAGKQDVGKGGIVKDPTVRERVLEEILSFCREIGLQVVDVIQSPITGQKGNVEYLAWLHSGENILTASDPFDKIKALSDID